MQAWPCFIRLYPSVPVTGTLYFLCWGSEWISAVPLGRPLPSVSRSWIHFSSGSMTLKEPRLWSWRGRPDFCTAEPLKRSPSFFSQNETLMSGGEARTFSLSLLESSGGSSSYWDLSGVTTKWSSFLELLRSSPPSQMEYLLGFRGSCGPRPGSSSTLNSSSRLWGWDQRFLSASAGLSPRWRPPLPPKTTLCTFPEFNLHTVWMHQLYCWHRLYCKSVKHQLWVQRLHCFCSDSPSVATVTALQSSSGHWERDTIFIHKPGQSVARKRKSTWRKNSKTDVINKWFKLKS